MLLRLLQVKGQGNVPAELLTRMNNETDLDTLAR